MLRPRDWSEHPPKLTAFWCRALFGMTGYVGNPFRRAPTDPFTACIHGRGFDRWLELFYDTVEVRWAGPNAEKVMALAANVVRVHRQQLIGDPFTEKGRDCGVSFLA